MPGVSGTLRRCSVALTLAAPLLGAAPAAAETGPITLATPGYELRVATDRLTLTTVLGGPDRPGHGGGGVPVPDRR